jgi:hypothetical protein
VEKINKESLLSSEAVSQRVLTSGGDNQVFEKHMKLERRQAEPHVAARLRFFRQASMVLLLETLPPF